MVSSNKLHKEISIILTVYFNNKKTKKCIKSLFENSGYPFELIIVVNGADESLKKYLKLIPAKIIWNKKNVGCATAENRGARLGKEYLVFIHTDMTFHKDWLKYLVEGYERLENPAYVFPMNILCGGHVNFHPLIKKYHLANWQNGLILRIQIYQY